MIITYNLKPLFKKDLGSFSKWYLRHKLWVVKLLKLNIEKSWFDYRDTRCCNLAILNVLPKLLPGPNFHFRFMKNSVHTSLLWSLLNTNLLYQTLMNQIKISLLETNLMLQLSSHLLNSSNKRGGFNKGVEMGFFSYLIHKKQY